MTKIDDRLLKIIQRRLGYTDQEFEKFKNEPRNIELIAKSKEYAEKYIVLKVVDSHGCNSNHKVGDKFYFDFAGNILTDLCPKRICGYALNNALMLVYTANEMIYAGVDPHEIRFKRSSCFDVGIECGGWGKIVLELTIEEKAAEK